MTRTIPTIQQLYPLFAHDVDARSLWTALTKAAAILDSALAQDPAKVRDLIEDLKDFEDADEADPAAINALVSPVINDLLRLLDESGECLSTADHDRVFAPRRAS